MTWAPLLGQLLFSTPFFVLCGLGLALAIVRWRLHPRVSLLVVLACTIELLAGLAGAVLSVLPLWHLARGGTNAQLAMFMATSNAVLGIVRVVGFGLLLAAAFSGRSVVAASPSTVRPT
jgi:hypothetical protein